MAQSILARCDASNSSIIEAYRAKGWICFEHPRKGTVSLNGHKEVPLAEGIKQMKAALEREAANPRRSDGGIKRHLEALQEDLAFRQNQLKRAIQARDAEEIKELREDIERLTAELEKLK